MCDDDVFCWIDVECFEIDGGCFYLFVGCDCLVDVGI